MNFYFKQACIIDKKLRKDRDLKTEEFDKYKLEKEKLYEKMTKTKPSSMTQQLERLLAHSNFVGLATIITKLLKSYLSSEMKPIIKQRAML